MRHGGYPNRPLRGRLRSSGLAALLVLGAGLSVPDPSAGAFGPGVTSSNFLKMGVGPRPVALGESFVGLADDINAITYNPAGLAGLADQELSMMHNEYFEGVRQEWVAYALPTAAYGTFAFSANMVNVDRFPAFDEFDRPFGETSASDQAFQIAYARRAGSIVHLGTAAKYLRSRLSEHWSSGFAFDAGIAIDLAAGLRFGASVLNGGPAVTFIEESYPLPLMGKAGVSYSPFAASKRHRLTVIADGTFPREGFPYVSGGVEWALGNAVALRMGGRQNQDEGPGFAVGAGIFLNRARPHGPELDVDYAYVGYGDIGHVHRFSLTFKFGRPKERDPETWPSREWKDYWRY